MRFFIKPRMILRRSIAVAVCGLVALSGQTAPAHSSVTITPFTNLDGVSPAAFASRPAPVSLISHLLPGVNPQTPGTSSPLSLDTRESPLADPQPCAGITATNPISWFTTDDVGNVDTSIQVDSYPTNTVVIAPGFQYDCVPKDTDLVVMVYNQAFGTDPALVDKRTLQASVDAGVFYYILTTPDGSPLQEGQWRVEFYQGKELLSSGSIVLGNSPDVDVSTQALVQGTVTDQRTGQPINQARVFVLSPGVTLADFLKDTQRADVYVQTRTDTNGQFSLWKPLERNTQYAMLIAADGYKLRGTDRLIIGDEASSPITLTIQLVKR